MKKRFLIGLGLLLAFIVFTLIVRFVDVAPIGPNGSSVGLSTMNGAFSNCIGVNWTLYGITDWLGFAAIGFGVTFGLYMLFNYVVINYRPVLINGNIEASYPSSTTLLSIVFLDSAIIQFQRTLDSKKLKLAVDVVAGLLMAFLVSGRLCSGVHWLSDILASPS